ncbi:MAG: hypothetical protein Kow00108_02740 [Calditrichia bacterium]
MIRLKQLTLPDKIGQLFIIPLHLNKPFNASSRERIERIYFRDFIPGGFFLQYGPVERVFQVSQWLQSLSKVPLWIAADLERGLSGVFSGGTDFPHAAMMGAADDPDLTYQVGRAIGREAASVGINMIFAPVADLLTPNQVINIRAFHSDPDKVTEHVHAFINGVQESPVMCVVKHFPGHGALMLDTHTNVSVIPENIEEHRKTFEMVAGKNPWVGIMTMHGVEPKSGLMFWQHLETHKAPIKGHHLWITDDLGMEGVKLSPEKTLGMQLFTSGHHHFLNPQPYRLIASQIREYVTEAEKVEELDERIQQILSTKRRIIQQRKLGFQKISKFVEAPAHQVASLEVASKGIICLKNEQFKPLSSDEHIIHRIITRENDQLSTLTLFRQKLNNFSGVTEEFGEPTAIPKNHCREIISIYQRVYGGVKPIAISAHLDKYLQSDPEINRVIIFWGNIFPFVDVMNKWKGTIFWVPSYMPVAQLATFEMLIGRGRAVGKLPVSLNAQWKAGWRQEIETHREGPEFVSSNTGRVHQVMEQYLEEGAYTGAILVHFTQEENKAFWWAVGKPKNNRLQPVKVTPDTWFDLASLTKIISTTPLVLHFISKNRLALETRLSEIYTHLPEEKKDINIKELLLHTSGLPAWKRLPGGKDKEEIIQDVLQTELEYKTGTQIVYSDLGFILLGDILEKISGKTLAELFRDVIARPLEVEKDLFYLSGNKLKVNNFVSPNADWNTRKSWRDFINDENARLFAGGAGHAGLFGNAKGIMRFVQWIFQGGRWFDHRIIDPNLLQESFKPHAVVSGQRRALGWDIPEQPSQAGTFYEILGSVGHLAYTGCSLWFNTEKQTATIFLSNRSFTQYSTRAFAKVRRDLHNNLPSF